MKRLVLTVATSLIVLVALAIMMDMWLARTQTRPPIGRHITCKSVAILAADFINPAPGETTTLIVRDDPARENVAVFESGDYVGLRMLKSGPRIFASNYIGLRTRTDGPFEIVTTDGVVTSYADQAEGSQAWTFTRSNVDTTESLMTGALVPADEVAFGYGSPLGGGRQGCFE